MVNLAPGADIQAAINANPAGTIFNLAAGTYTPNQLSPKAGNRFVGAPGAVWDGLGTARNAIKVSTGDTTRTGVVLQGLVIRNYIAPWDQTFPRAAVQLSSVANYPVAVIDNCEITGSTVGVNLGSNLNVTNCNIHHNTRYGLQGGPSTNVLVDTCEIAWNNTAHNDPTNDAGGTKIVGSSAGTSGVKWNNNKVHDNYGNGLWADGNVRCDYTNNTITNNRNSGIEHEISWDSIITGNTLSGNGTGIAGLSIGNGAQIFIVCSQNVQIYNNTITSDGSVGDGAIGIYTVSRTESEPPFSTHVETVSVHDNDIYMKNPVTGGSQGLKVGSGGTYSGVSFNNNHYYVENQATAYWTFAGAAETWTQFKASGQESTGTLATWGDPAPAPAPPPTVTITAPTNLATVSGRVACSAVGSSGTTRTELYIDGSLKATGTSSVNYTWQARKVANGSHTIMAKAYNSAGVGSAQITVSVV